MPVGVIHSKHVSDMGSASDIGLGNTLSNAIAILGIALAEDLNLAGLNLLACIAQVAH